MKYLAFVSILAGVTSEVSVEEFNAGTIDYNPADIFRNPEMACRTGCEIYFDGCNTCTCEESGKVTCTDMMCATVENPSNPPRCIVYRGSEPDPITGMHQENVIPSDDEKSAPPYGHLSTSACPKNCKTYYDGCNECTCNEDGSALCTTNSCLGVQNQRRKAECREEFPKGGKSTSTTRSDVTSASPSNGTPAPPYGRLSTSVCPKNCKTYYDGCNECVCNKDGSAACTVNSCLGVQNQKRKAECREEFPADDKTASSPLSVSRCPENCQSSYFDGCNTCMCLPDGSAACTRMACPSGNTGTPHCLDNDDEEAHSAQLVGTEAAYLPQLEKANTDGVACGEGCLTYFDGCNTCTCGAEGTMACTQKYCFTNLDTPRCLSYNINGEKIGNGGKPSMITSSSINPGVLEPALAAYTPDENSPRAAIQQGEKVVLSSLPSSPGMYAGVPGVVCPAQCKEWRDGCMECACKSEGEIGDCKRRLVCSEEKRTAAASCNKWGGKVSLRGRY